MNHLKVGLCVALHIWLKLKTEKLQMINAHNRGYLWTHMKPENAFWYYHISGAFKWLNQRHRFLYAPHKYTFNNYLN